MHHVSIPLNQHISSSLVPNFLGKEIPFSARRASVHNASSSPCSSLSHSWIIDTRATDHMVGSIDLLTTIISTIHIKVKLPNGQHVLATHIGTVTLAKDFVLNNVLYIPNFYVNLISTSKLTSKIS